MIKDPRHEPDEKAVASRVPYACAMIRLHVQALGDPAVGAPSLEPGGVRSGFVITDSQPDAVLVVPAHPVTPAELDDVRRRWADSSATVILAGHAALAGHTDASITPVHASRIRVSDGLWPSGDVVVVDRLGLIPAESPASVLATARQGLHDIPVAVYRDRTLQLRTGFETSTWADPAFLRLLHHMLITTRNSDVPSAIGMGLLGFGAIGAEHSRAIQQTNGLRMVAVCETNHDRLTAAGTAAPEARLLDNAEALLADAAVDCIIVSTPPDSHARWAKAALAAGKHVVLEKPMALTTEECDQVIDMADAMSLTAVVYQNRRFDPDFRILAQLVDAGRIGEVFHLEAFIGSYAHPCNYWHSDATVSGGALFDWGSHVIDQILQLMPGEVESVTAINHKRMWHDVTNADHSRMTLAFDGGREATFVYSDLAAALKPRWYVLGTEGGAVGDWRYERVITRSTIGTLDEDRLAPADAPPVMRFFTADGSMTTLSEPALEPHPFHADLALWLREGLPMRVQAHESRRVVAMLEAAELSASLGGLPVKPS